MKQIFIIVEEVETLEITDSLWNDDLITTPYRILLTWIPIFKTNLTFPSAQFAVKYHFSTCQLESPANWLYFSPLGIHSLSGTNFKVCVY